MVIWMSTVNSSAKELLEHLKNNKVNTSNNEFYEKRLSIIEEGLKEKVKLQDDLDVNSLVDILKLLYKQCMSKEEDIIDLNEEDEINSNKILNQQAKIDNLTSIRDKYENKIKELEETIEEDTNKIQELNRSLQKKKLTIDNLKQEIKSLQEVNDANEYEYNVKIGQLENQIERISNSESLLKNELERRIDSANYEKDSYHTVITKEQENGVSLLKENDALKSEIKNLNFKIKDYECKLLDLEDLAQLYEECVEEKKHIESELENYPKVMNDPNFQKSYFTGENNKILYGDVDGENEYYSDKSETLKEELEKINKTIDEDNSEIKSIKNVPTKITQDPDILNLIAQRQKKYSEASTAAATAAAIQAVKELNLESDSSSLENIIKPNNKEKEPRNDGESDNSYDSDVGNVTFNSINSGIFDDNSSFFLENDAEYKQSKAQQYLQPPSGNSLMPPKSPVLSASHFSKSLKSPKLNASSSLLPPPLKLSGRSSPINRSRSKSESKPSINTNSKVNNLVPKITSITTSISSILEKISETDLKTLNLQLRKSFDMVELANLSNKILQNILSDIEIFHKRYPLANALPTIDEDFIHRTSIAKSNNNDDNTEEGKDPYKLVTNDKKKYTEDSVALHNLALIIQNLLNELCKSRMLTNDYGKLYFQELENKSRMEAEKFLSDQSPQPTPKKPAKSHSLPKPTPATNKPELDGVSRHASLIRNKPTQTITRGGSLKETNFLNNWAGAFKNMFNKDETKSSSTVEAKEKVKKPEEEVVERGINENPVTSKKPEKSSSSSNFMDFFKFKHSGSVKSHHDKDKKNKKEKEKKSESIPSSSESKGKAPEQITEVSETHFTETPMDGTDLPATNNNNASINVIAASPSVPIDQTVRASDEEPVFSYNSSDISFISSNLDPLNIPIKDPRRLNLANAILSSSPYYHYDGEEIKPFSFKEDNEKPQFLTALAREEPMLPPTDSNLR